MEQSKTEMAPVEQMWRSEEDKENRDTMHTVEVYATGLLLMLWNKLCEVSEAKQINTYEELYRQGKTAGRGLQR